MNTRFSENEVRFRISRLELESLLSGHWLHLELDLPDQEGYQFRIHPFDVPGNENQPLFLNVREKVMELGVSTASLRELAMRLPSKEGLTAKVPSRGTAQVLRVALEVDSKDRL